MEHTRMTKCARVVNHSTFLLCVWPRHHAIRGPCSVYLSLRPACPACALTFVMPPLPAAGRLAFQAGLCFSANRVFLFNFLHSAAACRRNTRQRSSPWVLHLGAAFFPLRPVDLRCRPQVAGVRFFF